MISYKKWTKEAPFIGMHIPVLQCSKWSSTHINLSWHGLTLCILSSHSLHKNAPVQSMHLIDEGLVHWGVSQARFSVFIPLISKRHLIRYSLKDFHVALTSPCRFCHSVVWYSPLSTISSSKESRSPSPWCALSSERKDNIYFYEDLYFYVGYSININNYILISSSSQLGNKHQ